MAGQCSHVASRGRCGTDLAGPRAPAAGAESAGLGEDGGNSRQPAERVGSPVARSLPCPKLWPAPEWTPAPLSVVQDARPLIHLATPSSKLHFPEFPHAQEGGPAGSLSLLLGWGTDSKRPRDWPGPASC